MERELDDTRDRTTFAELTALEERYQLATYKKMPIVAERGEGAWLYTSEGEKYLDSMVVTRSPHRSFASARG